MFGSILIRCQDPCVFSLVLIIVSLITACFPTKVIVCLYCM